MFKVAESCDNHCNTVCVAVVNRLLVADRTARVNNCCNTCLVCYLYTVGEGEECVACHYAALERETEVTGFFDSMT